MLHSKSHRTCIGTSPEIIYSNFWLHRSPIRYLLDIWLPDSVRYTRSNKHWVLQHCWMALIIKKKKSFLEFITSLLYLPSLGLFLSSRILQKLSFSFPKDRISIICPVSSLTLDAWQCITIPCIRK